MKRRVLSLLLALFLAGGMISCSETTNTDPSAAPENAAAVPSAEETEPAEPEDPNAHLYEDLPAGDFEGRSCSILTPTPSAPHPTRQQVLWCKASRKLPSSIRRGAGIRRELRLKSDLKLYRDVLLKPTPM